MAVTRLNNMELRFGWAPHEDGWAASGVDANWQWIDALMGGVALDVVTTLPTTGLTPGMLYLMAPDAGSTANKLALYTIAIAEDGTQTMYWDFTTPVNDFRIFVASKKVTYRWVLGTEWIVEKAGVISFFAGGVLTDGQLIAEMLLPADVDLPATLPGSMAKVRTAGTGAVTISVRKNDAEVATLAFSAGVTVPVITAASAVQLFAGDSLSFVGPATADATFAGLSVTLLGVRKAQ